CLARRAGELSTTSGRIVSFFRWAPILGAAFRPRLLRGRSKSFRPGSSQLDLACRSRYKVFIVVVKRCRAEYLTSRANAQSNARAEPGKLDTGSAGALTRIHRPLNSANYG